MRALPSYSDMVSQWNRAEHFPGFTFDIEAQRLRPKTFLPSYIMGPTILGDAFSTDDESSSACSTTETDDESVPLGAKPTAVKRVRAKTQ